MAAWVLLRRLRPCLQRRCVDALSGDLVRDFGSIRPSYHFYHNGFDLNPGLWQSTNRSIVWKRLAALTVALEVQ